MYTIKEVELSNKQITKKRLVIEFSDPKKKIVAEFLMVDAPLLNCQVLKDFTAVLQGEKDEIIVSGNRTSLTIRKNKTKISDLYNDYQVISYSPYEMKTTTLFELTKMWLERLKQIE